MSIVTVEDIGVDSGAAGNQIIDGLRTGANDRSYNPSVSQIWEDNTTLTLKQGDFATYFTDEYKFYSGDGNEGIIVRAEGSPAGSAISNVDYAVLQLRIRRLFS